MNWYDELKKEFKKNDDDFKKYKCTLTLKQLKHEYEVLPSAQPFRAWSEKYVYFPIEYDGDNWLGSVLRNPCNKAFFHQK